MAKAKKNHQPELLAGMFNVTHVPDQVGIQGHVAISIYDVALKPLAAVTMTPGQFLAALGGALQCNGSTQSGRVIVYDKNIAEMERIPEKNWGVTPDHVRDDLTSLLFKCRAMARQEEIDMEERKPWQEAYALVSRALGELQAMREKREKPPTPYTPTPGYAGREEHGGSDFPA